MSSNGNPLNIFISVDITQLGKLAAASRDIATQVSSLSDEFAKNAATAATADEAIVKLAADTASTLAPSQAAGAGAAEGEAVANIHVTSAMAAARVEAGLLSNSTGMLVSGLARAAAASEVLAPVLQTMFLPFAAAGLVDLLAHGIESFEKWKNLADETDAAMNRLTIEISKQADALALADVRMSNMLARFHGQPENLVAAALIESKMRADEFAASLENAFEKMQKTLSAGPGFWHELITGSGNVSKFADALEPIQTEITGAQLALQLATTEEEKATAQAALHNTLLTARETIQNQLAEEKAQHTETITNPATGTPQTIGREPDPKAINAYESALVDVNTLLSSQYETRLMEFKSIELAQAEESKQALDLTSKTTEAEINAAKSVSEAKSKLAEQNILHGTFAPSGPPEALPESTQPAPISTPNTSVASQFASSLVRDSEQVRTAEDNFAQLTVRLYEAQAAMKSAEADAIAFAGSETLSAEASQKVVTAQSQVSTLETQVTAAERAYREAVEQSHAALVQKQSAASTEVQTASASTATTTAQSATSITARLEQIENDKNTVERQGLESRLNLERQYVAQGIGDHETKVRELESQLEALELTHQANIQRIRQEGVAREVTNANAEIESQEKVNESRLRMTETEQRSTFTQAGTPASIEAATAPLIQTTKEMFENQINALQEKATVLTQNLPAEAPRPTALLGAPELPGQIAAGKAVAPESTETYSKIQELSQQVIALRNEQSAAVTRIQQEETQKINQSTQQQLRYSEEIERQEEQLATKQAAAKEAAIVGEAQLEKAKLAGSDALAPAKITGGAQIDETEISRLREFENEKYQTIVEGETRNFQALNMAVISAAPESAEYQRSLAELKKLYADMEAAAVSHNAKMGELNRKQAQDAQEAMNQLVQTYMQGFAGINSSFNTFLGHMLQGNMRIGLAFREMGQQIVRSTIESLAQVALKTAEHWLIMGILQKMGLVQQQTTQTTADAAKVAEQKATQELMVTSAAGEAGAAAYAAAMEATPFPLDFAVAAAAASAATSATMGIGQAEQGALVPQDMPIYAHAGEMILPEHLSSGVQNIINQHNQTASAGGSDTHLHMNWSTLDSRSLSEFLHQPSTRSAFTKAMRNAVRSGMRLK